MKVRTLHIFNPETDYALAVEGRFYTPPASVIELRKRLALIPSFYAAEGDGILLLDDLSDDEVATLPYYDRARDKKLKIIPLSLIGSAAEAESFRVNPWGWNMPLLSLLSASSDRLVGLPDPGKIDLLRRLAHRRTTIAFLRECSDILPDNFIFPQEMKSTQEVFNEYEKNKDLFLKAPWSSSGRGVLRTSDLEWRHIEPWARGAIRSQGSLILERAFSKKLDFATEWMITSDKDVKYLGLSIFETSPRGKYQGNLNESQSELNSTLLSLAPSWGESIIATLSEAISSVIAPHYKGPLGIDMLVTADGGIHPCIEINLRHTMGMLNLI